MNKEQAVSIIERALNLSSQKGIFGLQDASAVFMALNTIKSYLIEIKEEKTDE